MNPDEENKYLCSSAFICGKHFYPYSLEQVAGKTFEPGLFKKSIAIE